MNYLSLMYHKIFVFLVRTIGPTDMKNFMNSVEEVMDSSESDSVVIYPMGQYFFDFQVQDGERKNLAFATPQERNAFQFGMKNAIALMGGELHSITKDEYESMDQMSEAATHLPGGSKIN